MKSVLKSGAPLSEETQQKLIHLITQSLAEHYSKMKLIEFTCDVTTLLAKVKNIILASNKDGENLVRTLFNLEFEGATEPCSKSIDECCNSILKLHPTFVEILAKEVQTRLQSENSLPDLEKLVRKSRLLTSAAEKSFKLSEILRWLVNSGGDYNLAEVVWYPIVFSQDLYYPAVSER